MKTRKGWLILRGKTYHAAWKIGGKLFTKSTGQTDKRNAMTRLAEIMEPYLVEDEARTLESVKARLEGAHAKLTAIDEARNPPPPVARVWDRFLASPARPDSGEATLLRYESEWKRFAAWLAREYADLQHLHQVTAAMVADYARDLAAAKVSASTYNQHRNLLRMVWRVLADECRLTANPWDKIMPRKLNSLANRKRALTPGQFDSLLSAVEGDPDLRDLFLLLAWTGLRRVDAVLLTWGSVDFARRVLTVAPVKTGRRTGKQIHIPMFPAALDVLNRRQKGRPLNPQGFVFPVLAKSYQHDPTVLTKNVSDAFKKAGMETTEERADRKRGVAVYGAHSLRHFFVSAATAASMPGAMIKSITGHATDGMLEHYQHLGADLAGELAAKIGNGNGTPKALPPARTVDAEAVRAIAEGMTAKTWKAARAELLALAGKE
jgi:integrase